MNENQHKTMMKDNPVTDPWGDDLLQFARLLDEIQQVYLTQEQYEELSENTNLEPHELAEIFGRAQEVHDAAKATTGRGVPPDTSSLRRSRSHHEDYELVGGKAWIAVEDPDRPKHGFDVLVKGTYEGVIVDVWPLCDEDVAGEESGEPLATTAIAFSDVLLYEDHAYRVRLEEIDWETDDIPVDLPSTLNYTVKSWNESDAISRAIDKASDEYGWLILGSTPIVEEV